MFSCTQNTTRDLEAGDSTPLPEILCTPEDDKDLRAQIRQIDGDKVQRVAILSFRSLQLHRIAKLQAELVKTQNAIMNPSSKGNEAAGDTEESLKEADRLLQRYGKAMIFILSAVPKLARVFFYD